MGRKKIQNKNKNISISLTNYQYEFVKSHPDFDLSKFVQLSLISFIELYDELRELKKEE